QLVLEPMREQQLSASLVFAMHAAFGGMFTIHSWVQGRVLQRSGALSLGVVNALRSSTVALASGLLFCSPAAPQQCLSVQTGSSAAVVSFGLDLGHGYKRLRDLPPKAQQQQPAVAQ
ncbi:uncharacterized protein HaLaN_08944, partial [Haematococcus lacustris]